MFLHCLLSERRKILYRVIRIRGRKNMINYTNEIDSETIADGVNKAHDRYHLAQTSYNIRLISTIVAAITIWIFLSGIMPKSELRTFIWLVLTVGVRVLWSIIPLIMSLVIAILAGIVVAMIIWEFSKVIAIAAFIFVAYRIFSFAYAI